MKILCVSAQALFPETRFGGAKRMFYLAKTLEASAELDLIHLDGCDEVRDPAAFAPPFRRQLFLPRAAFSMLDRAAVIPDAAKAWGAHRDEVAAFTGDTRYDATLLFFPSSLYVLDRDLVAHPGRIVYLEDDLYLERLRADARSAPGLARRLLKRLRVAQAGRFYRRNLARVSAVGCISPQEAALVEAEWKLPARLLGYGIPLKEFPMLPPPARSDVLGFIGNYRHLPNLDALHWLVESLFPAVRERVPGARLVLCGANFPDALRPACAKHPSIEVLEEVDDLATFYGRISVFVNPLREGRGLRTKVVEAAAYGRPVVSTALGAEGLESLRLGGFETPEELARALEAFRDPEAARHALAHNRAEVERLFSLEAVGAQLLELLAPDARRG